MLKKLSLLGSTLIIVLLVSVTAQASSDHFNFFRDNHKHVNPQLAKKMCQPVGKAVIDVNQKVQNDADSGQSGSYWGFDYFTRHIQVWQDNDNNPDTWCAILSYDGDTYAVPGQVGPGDNSPTGTRIDSPVHADMTGGARYVITGSMLASPTWTKKGNVGPTDYHCNVAGDCPNYVNWLDQYFNTGYSYDYQYWGWTYKAGSHGTWVNQCSTDIPGNPACTGNSGNIL